MSAHPAAPPIADRKQARLFHAGQGMHLPRAAVIAFAAVDSPAGRWLVTDAARNERLWNFSYHRAPRSVLLCRDGSVYLVGATPAELRERLRLADKTQTDTAPAGRCPLHPHRKGVMKHGKQQTGDGRRAAGNGAAGPGD